MEYKNSFVLYESVFKHFERLQKRDKELALEYINAIMNYGLYGEAPAEDSEIWDFGIDSDIASISTAKKKFSKKINIPKEELQEHLNKGLKQTEIASIYNCSVDTIQRRIKEYQITVECADTANRTATQNQTANTAPHLNVNVNDNVNENENKNVKVNGNSTAINWNF